MPSLQRFMPWQIVTKESAMGVAARQLAERFSLAAMTQQLLDLYQRLLKSPILASTHSELMCG
jgi:hypothetical protein